MSRIVILGNGITGITAAIRLRELQPDWPITVVSGESQYHYSRPSLMYVFMGHVRYQDTKPYEDSFWTEQRIDLRRAWVTRLDADTKSLVLQDGVELPFDQLLLATGSKSNKFGWPGQDLPGVQGLYDLMDLKLLYENSRKCEHAVIVGGGLIGIELAEMLHSRGVHVSFLVREQSYWDNVLPPEESGMINRLIRGSGMDLRLETELGRIVGGSDGRVRAVETKCGETIDCQLVGLTAGVSPNVDLVRESEIQVGRGILVDRSLRTNVDGVLAAGDCAEIVVPDAERNLLQQVWYTGKAQGLVAAEVMAGRRREYHPGTWYNSAKFLDLEYQVYGSVNLGLAGEQNLYWEHPDGMHSLRLVHVDRKLVGVNVMGIRYRHETCERWIDEGRDVDWVLEHLAEGNFDPEFFRRHEDDIRVQMRRQLS
ncbi:MAG: FAD-dependent oxidoreductase [Acidobacteriota bacterium]